MHHSNIPVKPLVAGMNEKNEPAQRIYFFEKPDGTILHTSDRDAWNIYAGRLQSVEGGRIKYKYIGTSDGSLFQKAVAEARGLFKTQGLEVSQNRIRKGVQEELELAKNNKTPPPNMDKMGNGARFI